MSYTRKPWMNIYWVAVLLWMILIFTSSAQPAHVSGANSKGIVAHLAKVADNFKISQTYTSREEILGKMDHYLRKATHFIVYIILSLLLAVSFRKSGFEGQQLYGIAFFACVLYAASDEFHQLFVPGRDGQLSDVLLDSWGGASGLFVYAGIKKIKVESN